MTASAANATTWATWAIASLAFARSQADVDGWAADNGRYLERLKAAWPAEHERIGAAAAAKGWLLP